MVYRAPNVRHSIVVLPAVKRIRFGYANDIHICAFIEFVILNNRMNSVH